MKDITVFHPKHLSDIPLSHTRPRLLAHVISIPFDNNTINLIRQSKGKSYAGFTLWRDPYDENVKLSYSIFNIREPVSEEEKGSILKAVRLLRDVGHMYHINRRKDGGVYVGIKVHNVPGNDAEHHHAELNRLSELMEKHNVPIVHYIPHPVSKNKALVIPTLAKPLVSGSLADLYEGGKESKEYKALSKAYRNDLSSFLGSVSQGNHHIFSADII